jgi:hypothetical protein
MSPGPLARPHQDIDTPLKCFACHGKGKGSMNERCVDCHTDIGWLIAHDRGFHANTKADACATCHPDHAGRDLDMVRWPEGSADHFDHQKTGWPLEGKHAPVKCRDCHTSKYVASPAAKQSKRKNPAVGWVGLERECRSCHEDIHRGSLGPECQSCHGVDSWKPAIHFDHAKTSYPLTGKHAPITCEKCHMAANLDLPKDAEGRPKPLYKPIPHAECTPCHVDPHAGRLGPACAKCHVTESFLAVTAATAASFDHDKTRYPLRGRHIVLKCAQCHDPTKAWGKKPVFSSCGACHKDPHAGRATIEGRVIDCASCHQVEGFRVNTYTVEQHHKSAYPLEGRHRAVACEKCHLKNPPGVAAGSLGAAGVQLRPAHAKCLDCHRDDHDGQLASWPGGVACEPCHDVAGWKPSLFSVAQHAKLKLPLEGRHARIDCAACHGPARKGLAPLPPQRLGRAGVALVVKETDCVACHYDAHGGRFGPDGVRAKKDGCATCHNLTAFRPAAVDVAAHRDFDYALLGAHRAIPCDACHVESRPAPTRSSLLLAHGPAQAMTFTTKGTTCEACHQTPHGGQFDERGKAGQCASCHGDDAFRPATKFNHDVDAAFSLKGAHARVPCAKCHASTPSAGGRASVIYRPVPHTCEDCHGKHIPRGTA